jgi:hypothetical protein
MIEILDIEEECYHAGSPLPLRDRTASAGDLVQLKVHDGKRGEVHRGEILWFKVLSVRDEQYSGQLTEEPKSLNYFKKGSYLQFETRHILDVRRQP